MRVNKGKSIDKRGLGGQVFKPDWSAIWTEKHVTTGLGQVSIGTHLDMDKEAGSRPIKFGCSWLRFQSDCVVEESYQSTWSKAFQVVSSRSLWCCGKPYSSQTLEVNHRMIVLDPALVCLPEVEVTAFSA